jgi:hypothetical protein
MDITKEEMTDRYKPGRPVEDKTTAHDSIATDVEKFLSSGGTITEIDTGVTNYDYKSGKFSTVKTWVDSPQSWR